MIWKPQATQLPGWKNLSPARDILRSDHKIPSESRMGKLISEPS